MGDFAEFNDRVNLPKWSKNTDGNKDPNIFHKVFKSMNRKNNAKNDDQQKCNKLDHKLNAMFFEYFAKRWDFTCRFDTRIDYILSSNTEWIPTNCGFEDTIKTDLTDHKLYWCEFER